MLACILLLVVVHLEISIKILLSAQTHMAAAVTTTISVTNYKTESWKFLIDWTLNTALSL